jgi:hypothetical protein
MVAQVKYLVVGRLRGRVTLCMVYIVHKEMRSAGFLVEAENQGRWFVSGLASKPLGQFVSGLASKLLGWFLLLLPQNRQLQFGGLGLKIITTVLLVWASKPSGLRFVDCAIKLMGG